MSVEDILRKIEEEADSRKKSIIEGAYLEAERKIESAEKEIKKKMQALLEEARSKIELEGQRYLAEARLQGKTLLSEAKYKLLKELREGLKKAFFEKIEEEIEAKLGILKKREGQLKFSSGREAKEGGLRERLT